MSGYIRLGNKRKGHPRPLPWESVVSLDRSNPVLGNRHELKNHRDPVERSRVIEAFRKDIEGDFALKGPMYEACRELALRVIRGDKIRGMCWCYPEPCHGDVIIEKIKAVIRGIEPQHLFLEEEPRREAQGNFGFC